jgi:hypothetical protein
MLFSPIFFDQFAGFLKEEFSIDFKITLIFKLIVLIGFILGTFILVNKKNIYSLVYIILIFLIYFSWYIFIGYSTAIRDLQFIAEVFLMPIAYLFFLSFFKKIFIPVDTFLKGINIVMFFIFGAVFISLLGFGLSSYGQTSAGESIGYKGYFMAGNELSSLVLIFSSLTIYNYKTKRLRLNVITTILLIATSFLIGSKTLILGCFVIIISIPILKSSRDKNRMLKISKKTILFFLMSMLFLMPVFIYGLKYITPLINRLVYKFNAHDSIITFIMSNRNNRIQPAITNYVENSSLGEFLLGMGYSRTVDENLKLFKYGLVEIDLFDVLVVGGFVLLIITYFIWVVFIRKIYMEYKLNSHMLVVPIFASFMLLFFNSFIAGHIIYSSIIAIYLGLATAYIMAYRKKSDEINL